jgi:hypothetical protein
VTNTVVQLPRDEAIGIAKEAANSVIGATNLIDNGFNALLGTNLQTPEFKPSTPGEKAAMLGTALALFVIPELRTADAVKLGKSLASEAQVAGAAVAPIAGAGEKGGKEVTPYGGGSETC